MEISAVTHSLAALAQGTRLAVFRALLEYGKTGLPAGKLGERLNVPHNTLSFHLSQLKQAGLVSSSRNGRQLIYVANTEAVERLIAYLSENCCIREDGGADECEIDPPTAGTAAKLCGNRP